MSKSNQDELYEQASAEHGAAIGRLCRAYEADPAKRAELRQEIHLALWRSLAHFKGECALRTWVFRVGHNTAVTHLLRNKRIRSAEMISLDDLDSEPAGPSVDTDRELALARLLELIQRLKPVDRQVITLYLEGENAGAIGEITGLSPGNVATKIHRLKALLGRQFAAGQTEIEKGEAMPEQPTPLNAKQLWQSQSEEETNMTLQFVRYKAQEFQNRIQFRNRREYIFAAIAVLLFGAMALLLPGLLTKAGALLLLASTLYVGFDLRKNGSAKQLPTETGATACLSFHRQELERQRNLLRRVVSYHIPSQIPGVALMMIGTRLQHPEMPRIALIGQIVFGTAVFGLVAYLNWRAANRYQRELDALAE